MGKNGRLKPFVDKKNSTTYTLVCRDVDDGSDDEEVAAGDDRVFARVQARLLWPVGPSSDWVLWEFRPCATASGTACTSWNLRAIINGVLIRVACRPGTLQGPENPDVEGSRLGSSHNDDGKCAWKYILSAWRRQKRLMCARRQELLVPPSQLERFNAHEEADSQDACGDGRGVLPSSTTSLVCSHRDRIVSDFAQRVKS